MIRLGVDPDSGVMGLLKEGQKVEQRLQDDVYEEIIAKLAKTGTSIIDAEVHSDSFYNYRQSFHTS